MVAAAMIGSAVVGGVVSSSAASKASSAQESAANKAANASQYASDIQKQIYDQQREDFAPWRSVGTSALGQLADLYGLASPYAVTSAKTNDNQTNVSNLEAQLASVNSQLSSQPATQKKGYNLFNATSSIGSLTKQQADLTSQLAAARAAAQQQTDPNAGQSTEQRQQSAMDKFFTSPNYNFTLNEGLKSLDRYAAASGGFASGNTLKAASNYAENMASNEFGNYQNTLLSMSGLGQNAANSTASAGNAYSNAVGNNASNMGNAYLASGNARATGYQNQAAAINQGLENVSSYYTLSSMMG